MHNEQKVSHTDDNNKKYSKVKDHCHLLENIEELVMIYAI